MCAAGNAPRIESRNPPKLNFEIGDKLLHRYVVQLLDVAIQAGFDFPDTIRLAPIDPAKR